MNDDQVHQVLNDGIPPAPPPTGWAAKAARNSTMRRAAIKITALAAVLVVPTAVLLSQEPPMLAIPAITSLTTTDPTGHTDVTSPGSPSVTDAPPSSHPGEVTGIVDIYQSAKEEHPHLCLGVVLYSDPPQCSGPTLIGDFSWDEVPHNEAAGVRWTTKTFEVIGMLDLEEGDNGAFTLTRPILQKDAARKEDTPLDLSALCADPLREADPNKVDHEAQIAFSEAVEGLPVIDVWSNSEDEYGFNVLVRGDAEEVFGKLRSVWGGPLCVGSAEGPTKAERQAALQRVTKALPPGMLLSASAGTGREAALEVRVVRADAEIMSQIRQAAGEGLGGWC